MQAVAEACDSGEFDALEDESAAQGQTWTAAALCDWLAIERGVSVSAAWLTEALREEGFRWNRAGTRCGTRPTRPPAG
ncbi:winged helix-turn-helix domain-containing protein [Streptantibioticus rubrisoli]|uniref:Winged helix-turn-helix domain-containing protein n=1 Tax=Streptantibioticus rubrisoli TaxID=1387313 RepID=A0ABT1PL18_9ACTN|nr:winged helix-turn-helix domain-containing protein [Streptantibioticus rubrisoli]MCQ4046055.1 winged helix-turn-helix domain-containing protein [Streptantibioticus rubrisoli]